MSKNLEVGKEYKLASTKMRYIKKTPNCYFFELVGDNPDGFEADPQGEFFEGEDTSGLVGLPCPISHLINTGQIEGPHDAY